MSEFISLGKKKMINQAVIFTKPLNHISTNLTSIELNHAVTNFFQDKGFVFKKTKQVSSKEIILNNIIDRHYLIYSYACRIDSISKIQLTNKGELKFKSAFGISWDKEIDNRRLLSLENLQKKQQLTSLDISRIWNKHASKNGIVKVQPGLLLCFDSSINAYIINGFYPIMADRFSHKDYTMNYYVVEFDSSNCSWSNFRKVLLGSTDCRKANKKSFRGKLYSEYLIDNPTSNNFIHGSAGPLEGLIERIIHEKDLNYINNPIGKYLNDINISFENFKEYYKRLSINNLSSLFDSTEEKNSEDIFLLLNNIFS